MSDTEVMAQSLCKVCGLCCDGTLFGCTTLSEEDRERVFGLDPFKPFKGEPSLPQPCPALDEGVCTLYDHRPKACRTFVCRPLKKFIRGDAQYDDIAKLIADTRNAIDRSKANMTSVSIDDRADLRTKRTSEFEHFVALYSARKTFGRKV